MIVKIITLFFSFIFLVHPVLSQLNEKDSHYHEHDVYELDWKKRELFVIGAGLTFTAIGHVMLQNSESPSLQEIENLNVNNLNFLDRSAANNMSESSRNLSDIILMGAGALPFLSYFSSSCRPNAGSIGVMAVETFLLNLGLTNITKATFKRYRPYNYNPNTEEELLLSQESRRSFISGHASNTAALAFLTARVLTDAHPEYKKKYIIWTTAATIPAVISYLRVRAGRHFPTDVIGGYVVGATIGYLIPEIHLKDNIDIEMQGIGGLSLKVNF